MTFIWTQSKRDSPPLSLTPRCPGFCLCGRLCRLWDQRAPLCFRNAGLQEARTLPVALCGLGGSLVPNHVFSASPPTSLLALPLSLAPGCVSLWSPQPFPPLPGPTQGTAPFWCLRVRWAEGGRDSIRVTRRSSLHLGDHSRSQSVSKEKVPFALSAPLMHPGCCLRLCTCSGAGGLHSQQCTRMKVGRLGGGFKGWS